MDAYARGFGFVADPDWLVRLRGGPAAAGGGCRQTHLLKDLAYILDSATAFSS